jgi:hypothetical protein
MKVKDTLSIDLIYITITEKVRVLVAATPYLYTNTDDGVKIIKQYFPSWQYNGVVPFGDVLRWCEEHFGNDWIWDWETVYFKREEDKTAFLLRWA